MPEHGGNGLGVMTPDSVRTILVVSEGGDLAVALREKVDRVYALVRDIRPEEMEEGLAACMPWPWMVVGQVEDLDNSVLRVLRTRPVLIFWRGLLPNGLPTHARSFALWGELARAVHQACTQEVAGMKLAVGLGVDLPDGSFARSAELQALVAAHPHPFDMPLDAFRSAARVLSQHHIPLRPGHPDRGMVSLVAAEGTA